MHSLGVKDDPTAVSAVDAAARRSGRRRLALGLSVAFGGIVLSLLLAWLLLGREQKLAEMQFKLDAGKRIETLQRAVADRLGTVSTVAAFFCGSQLVERNEFRTFTAPILERHPGIQALAWVPRIPATRRQTHEQAVRNEGFSHYEIGQHGDHGRLVPAGKRDEYYPILFVEPSRESQSLIGFDLGSDAACHGAIGAAMATGRQAVAVCQPLDDNETDRSLLYVVEPAWNEDAAPAKRPADQPEIDGFVLGIFRIGTLVEASLNFFPPVGIDIYITVPSEGGGKSPVYTRLSPLCAHAGALPPTGGMHLSGKVDIADSHWTVDCVPMASYLAKQRTWGPVGALLAGLVVTGLLTGYLWLLSGRTARVERHVAEQTHELRESEQRFRSLVDNAGDAFFLHDEQGKILDVSRRACDSLGYAREELLSMTLADVDVDFVPRNLAQYLKLAEEEYPVSIEGVHRRKDGTTFPVEIRLAPLDLGSQRLMLGLARDITDRKRLEAAIHQEQRLLREMLDLHERERKLVAYEIHDGLAQQLTGALYKFQSVGRLRERDPEAAQEMFDEAVRLLREAMAETRRLISGLRPPVLDESGIVAAIDYLIAERRTHAGPEIEFVHEAQFGRLAPPLESALFRIVQECLTNACRYSQSEKVRVELGQAEGRVRIDVQDWGVGFDPAQVGGDHCGLQGIRERARLLGGAVVIRTAPQQGTRITVELPLVPQAENGTAQGPSEK